MLAMDYKLTGDFILLETNHFKPEIGIILGTGLGGLVKEIEIAFELSYDKIPNFPLSTVESHSGKLIFGMLSGKKVVAMQGRFHFYEGYSMEEVVFPVRVFKYLGISKLFISNACGALNPSFKAGSIMAISDHINLLPSNPLLGKNDYELGVRFPDMSNAYNKNLISLAQSTAEKFGIHLLKGVYVAVSGPNLETSAEYKFLRIIGGDVVGMSTVPEVIAAAHCSLEVFAISVITDEGYHIPLESVSVEQVIKVAMETEPKMTQLIVEMIREV